MGWTLMPPMFHYGERLDFPAGTWWVAPAGTDLPVGDAEDGRFVEPFEAPWVKAIWRTPAALVWAGVPVAGPFADGGLFSYNARLHWFEFKTERNPFARFDLTESIVGYEADERPTRMRINHPRGEEPGLYPWRLYADDAGSGPHGYEFEIYLPGNLDLREAFA